VIPYAPSFIPRSDALCPWWVRAQLGDADCSDTAVNILPEREQAGATEMECGTQTETRAMLNASAQARLYRSAAVQTGTLLAEMAPEEFERIRVPLDQIGDIQGELEKWGISGQLVKSAVEVCDQNLGSHIFEHHDVEWDTAPAQVTRLLTLRCAPRAADGGAHKPDERREQGEGRKQGANKRGGEADPVESTGMPVAGVSWNSSGNMLAVCYGRMDLKGTDQEASCVAVWNLKRVFVQQDKPDHRLETSCSVISVAFHPQHPAILVAGTYGGEVLAWNLGNETDKTSISVLKGERAHREAVTALEWTKDPIQQDYKLMVSCSSDGKVVLWKLKDLDLDSLWPVASFNMVPGDMEAAQLGLTLAHQKQRAKALGLTSLAFDKYSKGDLVSESGVFVVGTETGGVFKCLLDVYHVYDRVPREIRFSAVPAPETPMEMKCPIAFSYAPHFGPVHDVAFSRLQRNVFASCGADGTIRIHNLQQATAHVSLEPSLSYAYSIAWSPSKPLVLAVGSGAGKVFLYNLAVDKVRPVETLQLTEGSNVGALSFSTDGSMIAAGDWSGISGVWTLSKDLSRSSPSDAADIVKFGAARRATE